MMFRAWYRRVALGLASSVVAPKWGDPPVQRAAF